MNKSTDIPVEQRLSALLLKGWTMLSEACSTCPDQCPIMKSQRGQKYCCGCQALINDKTKERQFMKFSDLISAKQKQIQPPTTQPIVKPQTQTTVQTEQPVKQVVKEEIVSTVKESKPKETTTTTTTVTTRGEEKDVVLAALYGRLDYLAKMLNTLEDSCLIESTTNKMVTLMDAIAKYKSLSK